MKSSAPIRTFVAAMSFYAAMSAVPVRAKTPPPTPPKAIRPARNPALEKFMKDSRKQNAMTQTDSGLCYHFNATGSGIRPRPQDTVVLSYTVLAADGSKLPQLDADHIRTKVSDLLPGLEEGVRMMTIGSQVLLLLPPALSFGDGPWPEGVAPGMPLAFSVTLHDVSSPESAP
jgi:FKBP-type peptidyl-prolyl cis-trans isomerase